MDLVTIDNFNNKLFLNIKELVENNSSYKLRMSFSKSSQFPIMVFSSEATPDFDMESESEYLVTVEISSFHKTISETESMINDLMDLFQNHQAVLEAYNMYFKINQVGKIVPYERGKERFYGKTITFDCSITK